MTKMTDKYEPVIGLEIHLQLKTQSKMFSSAANNTWEAEPNSMVSPVELGLPGALPVPNELAIVWTQRFGKALNCTLRKTSKFDRKNYFYPDLPKGYQISQYDEPLCENGYLAIMTDNTKSADKVDAAATKTIRIRRIHLEEDTGKSIHENGNTYLDYNKSGVPLVELVTEPDFTSADECSEFAKMVQEAARTLGISDVNMERGHMRLEANISVRKKHQQVLPNYRVEVKNLNSFKFMRDAINFEIARQIAALEEEIPIMQETRGWDVKKGVTYVQRTKEEAHDYRYFPEPDIPPLKFEDEYFNQILQDMPMMPWDIENTLLTEGVRPDFAKLLAYNSEKYTLFLDLKTKNLVDPQELVKIICNTADLSQVGIKIETLADANQPHSNLSTDALSTIIQQVIAENPAAIRDYQSGKPNAVKFLVGQVMKASRGKADPIISEKLLLEYISPAI